jgi:hypothetical protein
MVEQESTPDTECSDTTFSFSFNFTFNFTFSFSFTFSSDTTACQTTADENNNNRLVSTVDSPSISPPVRLNRLQSI